MAHDWACMSSSGISLKPLLKPAGSDATKSSKSSETSGAPSRPSALALAEIAEVHRYRHLSACLPISATWGPSIRRVQTPIPIGEASEAETCEPQGMFMCEVQSGKVLATHQSSNLTEPQRGLTPGSFKDLNA